ncbi:transcriptional repressor scratch 1 [Ditylenchus destructor]|uniref:Transcriptional repressor scratch 1 n=1 Tax=Ditylenchus destructor TaxID=166010 RepID=A0AAD4MN05_9BILA|nr:transcriptional repressor scratch 1 [Ditylenchus destructor]
MNLGQTGSLEYLTGSLENPCGPTSETSTRPTATTAEKPFSCKHCERRFADKCNLRAHEQTHNVEKRYACANCGRRFALKSFLSKHEDSSCRQGRLGLRARQRASGSNVIATQ